MNLIGQRVYKAREYSAGWYARWGGISQERLPIGTCGTIVSIFGDNTHILWDGFDKTHNHDRDELELLGGIMRRRFLLLKDTPEVKAGAIFEEKADAADQDFSCINYEEFKEESNTCNGCYFPRKVILNQHFFFEEISPIWLNAEDLKAFKDFMADLKRKDI